MKNAIRLSSSHGFIKFILCCVQSNTEYYGPLVSCKFMDGISKGDYSQRLVLRKGDELQQLANDLNQMAVNLEKRHVHGFEDKSEDSDNSDIIAS